MFQFTHLPPLHLWIQCRVPAHYHGWVSPFGNPRIKDCSASPRGLSQPSTSFIGSRCQGIHRVPLFSYFRTRNKEHQLSLCSYQGASGSAAGLCPPEGGPGAPCVPVPESRAMDTGRRPRNAIVPALTRSTFFQASPLCSGKVTPPRRGSTSGRGRPRCRCTDSLERR